MPAPVLSSEQVNDPSVKGLKKCFDPQCHKKKDSDSCDGVVGCYWCVRDKNDAPLVNKYCADINSCYGGKEGKIETHDSRAEGCCTPNYWYLFQLLNFSTRYEDSRPVKNCCRA